MVIDLAEYKKRKFLEAEELARNPQPSKATKIKKALSEYGSHKARKKDEIQD